MCRGNGGQRVFRGAKDYEGFLTRLGRAAVDFHVEIHAYALMSNHVHLFMRTREANLSRFMQRLLTGYTQWFNFKHKTYGHLFQGRYKALLVDRSGYGAEVSRYIHLNPVRVAEGAQKSVTARQAMLRDYRWSSYRAMIGLARREEWLAVENTVERFGTEERERERGYATFVEEGLLQEVNDPAEEATAQSILGRDRFVDRIRRLMRTRRLRDRECATLHRQLLSERLAKVVERVARAYGIAAQELVRRTMGPRGNEARQMAMWLARERCGGAVTTRDIGRAMGGVSGSAIGAAHRRIAGRMVRDKRLRRIVARLV